MFTFYFYINLYFNRFLMATSTNTFKADFSGSRRVENYLFVATLHSCVAVDAHLCACAHAGVCALALPLMHCARCEQNNY